MIPSLSGPSSTVRNVIVDAPAPRPSGALAKLATDVAAGLARDLATEVARGLAVASSRTPSSRSARARSAGAGYARTASASSATGAKAASGKGAQRAKSTGTGSASGSLSFLHDPSLSVEQKLMRLLGHLNAQYETEMQQRMEKIAGGGQQASGAAGGSTTKKKSAWSAIAAGVTSFLPGVGIAAGLLKDKTVQSVLKKIGGPVLGAAATAMGFPQIAPALVKFGPQIVDAVGSVAKELGSSGGGSGAASGTGSSSSGKALSEGDRQIELMELQRLQEKQKEMFQLVSNIFRAMHDTRMTIVGNVR